MARSLFDPLMSALLTNVKQNLTTNVGLFAR